MAKGTVFEFPDPLMVHRENLNPGKISNMSSNTSSNNGKYRLSTGELQARKSAANSEARKQRLLQVRAQEKQKAVQKNKVYRQRVLEETQKTVNHLEREWESHKRADVAALQAQYAKAVNNVGRGHKDANYSATYQAMMQQKQQEEQMANQQKAMIRHDAALQEEYAHRALANADAAAAEARRTKTKAAEAQRALERIAEHNARTRESARRKLAEQREHARQSGHLPGTTVATHHHNSSNNKSAGLFPSQLAPQAYKYTHFHEWTEKHAPDPTNGRMAAAVVSAQSQYQAELLARERQEAEAAAKERARAAALRVHMEQMRKSLMSDLAEVEREETARRKRAVMKRDVRGAPVLDRWRRERHLAALDAAFEEAFLPDVDLATQSPEMAAETPSENIVQEDQQSPTPVPQDRPGTRIHEDLLFLAPEGYNPMNDTPEDKEREEARVQQNQGPKSGERGGARARGARRALASSFTADRAGDARADAKEALQPWEVDEDPHPELHLEMFEPDNAHPHSLHASSELGTLDAGPLAWTSDHHEGEAKVAAPNQDGGNSTVLTATTSPADSSVRESADGLRTAKERAVGDPANAELHVLSAPAVEGCSVAETLVLGSETPLSSTSPSRVASSDLGADDLATLMRLSPHDAGGGDARSQMCMLQQLQAELYGAVYAGSTGSDWETEAGGTERGEVGEASPPSSSLRAAYQSIARELEHGREMLHELATLPVLPSAAATSPAAEAGDDPSQGSADSLLAVGSSSPHMQGGDARDAVARGGDETLHTVVAGGAEDRVWEGGPGSVDSADDVPEITGGSRLVFSNRTSSVVVTGVGARVDYHGGAAAAAAALAASWSAFRASGHQETAPHSRAVAFTLAGGASPLSALSAAPLSASPPPTGGGGGLLPEPDELSALISEVTALGATAGPDAEWASGARTPPSHSPQWGRGEGDASGAWGKEVEAGEQQHDRAQGVGATPVPDLLEQMGMAGQALRNLSISLSSDSVADLEDLDQYDVWDAPRHEGESTLMDSTTGSEYVAIPPPAQAPLLHAALSQRSPPDPSLETVSLNAKNDGGVFASPTAQVPSKVDVGAPIDASDGGNEVQRARSQAIPTQVSFASNSVGAIAKDPGRMAPTGVSAERQSLSGADNTQDATVSDPMDISSGGAAAVLGNSSSLIAERSSFESRVAHHEAAASTAATAVDRAELEMERHMLSVARLIHQLAVLVGAPMLETSRPDSHPQSLPRRAEDAVSRQRLAEVRRLAEELSGLVHSERLTRWERATQATRNATLAQSSGASAVRTMMGTLHEVARLTDELAAQVASEEMGVAASATLAPESAAHPPDPMDGVVRLCGELAALVGLPLPAEGRSPTRPAPDAPSSQSPFGTLPGSVSPSYSSPSRTRMDFEAEMHQKMTSVEQLASQLSSLMGGSEEVSTHVPTHEPAHAPDPPAILLDPSPAQASVSPRSYVAPPPPQFFLDAVPTASVASSALASEAAEAQVHGHLLGLDRLALDLQELVKNVGPVSGHDDELYAQGELVSDAGGPGALPPFSVNLSDEATSSGGAHETMEEFNAVDWMLRSLAQQLQPTEDDFSTISVSDPNSWAALAPQNLQSIPELQGFPTPTSPNCALHIQEDLIAVQDLTQNAANAGSQPSALESSDVSRSALSFLEPSPDLTLHSASLQGPETLRHTTHLATQEAASAVSDLASAGVTSMEWTSPAGGVTELVDSVVGAAPLEVAVAVPKPLVEGRQKTGAEFEGQTNKALDAEDLGEAEAGGKFWDSSVEGSGQSVSLSSSSSGARRDASGAASPAEEELAPTSADAAPALAPKATSPPRTNRGGGASRASASSDFGSASVPETTESTTLAALDHGMAELEQLMQQSNLMMSRLAEDIEARSELPSEEELTVPPLLAGARDARPLSPGPRAVLEDASGGLYPPMNETHHLELSSENRQPHQSASFAENTTAQPVPMQARASRSCSISDDEEPLRTLDGSAERWGTSDSAAAPSVSSTSPSADATVARSSEESLQQPEQALSGVGGLEGTALVASLRATAPPDSTLARNAGSTPPPPPDGGDMGSVGGGGGSGREDSNGSDSSGGAASSAGQRALSPALSEMLGTSETSSLHSQLDPVHAALPSSVLLSTEQAARSQGETPGNAALIDTTFESQLEGSLWVRGAESKVQLTEEQEARETGPGGRARSAQGSMLSDDARAEDLLSWATTADPELEESGMLWEESSVYGSTPPSPPAAGPTGAGSMQPKSPQRSDAAGGSGSSTSDTKTNEGVETDVFGLSSSSEPALNTSRESLFRQGAAVGEATRSSSASQRSSQRYGEGGASSSANTSVCTSGGMSNVPSFMARYMQKRAAGATEEQAYRLASEEEAATQEQQQQQQQGADGPYSNDQGKTAEGEGSRDGEAATLTTSVEAKGNRFDDAGALDSQDTSLQSLSFEWLSVMNDMRSGPDSEVLGEAEGVQLGRRTARASQAEGTPPSTPPSSRRWDSPERRIEALTPPTGVQSEMDTFMARYMELRASGLPEEEAYKRAQLHADSPSQGSSETQSQLEEYSLEDNSASQSPRSVKRLQVFMPGLETLNQAGGGRSDGGSLSPRARRHLDALKERSQKRATAVREQDWNAKLEKQKASKAKQSTGSTVVIRTSRSAASTSGSAHTGPKKPSRTVSATVPARVSVSRITTPTAASAAKNRARVSTPDMSGDSALNSPATASASAASSAEKKNMRASKAASSGSTTPSSVSSKEALAARRAMAKEFDKEWRSKLQQSASKRKGKSAT